MSTHVRMKVFLQSAITLIETISKNGKCFFSPKIGPYSVKTLLIPVAHRIHSSQGSKIFFSEYPIDLSNRRLLPRSVHPYQTAHRPRKAHDPIVKVGVSEGRAGDAEIAEVRNELEIGGIALPAKRTISSMATMVVTRERGLTWQSSCSQQLLRHPSYQLRTLSASIDRGCRSRQRHYTSGPQTTLCTPLAVISSRSLWVGYRLRQAVRQVSAATCQSSATTCKEKLATPKESTYVCHSIKAQIHPIPQLPPYRQILQHRIHALRIARNSRRLEVLHILANSEHLSRKAELPLDGLEGGDDASWVVGAVEIPGVEAGEILEGAEEFVTTNCWDGNELEHWLRMLRQRLGWVRVGRGGLTCSRNEAQVVRYCRVIDKSVGDHDVDGG